MLAAFAKGDVEQARPINARLLPSYQFMNSDTCVFSQAVKVAMGVLGVPVGECRLPLGPPPEGTAAAATSSSPTWDTPSDVQPCFGHLPRRAR